MLKYLNSQKMAVYARNDLPDGFQNTEATLLQQRIPELSDVAAPAYHHLTRHIDFRNQNVSQRGRETFVSTDNPRLQR